MRSAACSRAGRGVRSTAAALAGCGVPAPDFEAPHDRATLIVNGQRTTVAQSGERLGPDRGRARAQLRPWRCRVRGALLRRRRSPGAASELRPRRPAYRLRRRPAVHILRPARTRVGGTRAGRTRAAPGWVAVLVDCPFPRSRDQRSHDIARDGRRADTSARITVGTRACRPACASPCRPRPARSLRAPAHASPRDRSSSARRASCR